MSCTRGPFPEAERRGIARVSSARGSPSWRARTSVEAPLTTPGNQIRYNKSQLIQKHLSNKNEITKCVKLQCEHIIQFKEWKCPFY